jgi:hypothetical protein
MAGKSNDRHWDADLLRQQLGELQAEVTRLKRELERSDRARSASWRQLSELRRLVQDAHHRERSLRQKFLTVDEAARGADAAVALASGDGAGQGVDPTLIERIPPLPALPDAWPTPLNTLPPLSVHPGWGNYGAVGQDTVVIGVSLLGHDAAARKRVIELVVGQQMRQPALRPLFITDSDDFRDLRQEHYVFEYLPPWPGAEVEPSAERWEQFLLHRLAVIQRKWGIARFLVFPGTAAADAEVAADIGEMPPQADAAASDEENV